MIPATSVSMRVASAHSTGASQKSPLLSIDDVYKLAERTRMRTTLEARHLVLAQTQRTVPRDPALPRPDTGILTVHGKRWFQADTMDKSTSPSSGEMREKGPLGTAGGEEGRETGEEPEVAVPPLGFVRNVHISFRPRTFLTSYHDNNNRHRLSLGKAETLPAGIVSASCPRTGEGDAGTLCCMCQCIDVTCPCACRDCRKLHTESVASERMQTTFPALSLTERHVTSSALVRRARPDMTPTEIQEKIKSGQIASSALIFPRYHNREKDDTDEEDEELKDLHADSSNHQQETSRPSDEMDIQGRNSVDSLPKQTSSRTKTPSPLNSMSLLGKLKMKFGRGEATTPHYFMDLRHMNSKIFHGRTSRSLTVPGEERRKRTVRSDSKPLWPAFVSPRKCKLIEEPTYKAYFDPPLLAKHKQIPNPAFFAGSSDPYSLPERLPDVLELSGGKMAITDPNALVSDSSSSKPGQSSPATPAAAAAAVTAAQPSAVRTSASSAVNVTSASSAVPVTSESATAPAVSESTAAPAVSESTAAPVTSEPTVADTPSSSAAITASAGTASTAAGATGAPMVSSVTSSVPASAASSADSAFAPEFSASAANAAASEVAPTETVVLGDAEAAVSERGLSTDAAPVTAACIDGRSSVSGHYDEE